MLSELILASALALPPSSFPNPAKVRAWQEFSDFLTGVDPYTEYFATKDKDPLPEHGWVRLPFIFDGYKIFGRKIPIPMAMAKVPNEYPISRMVDMLLRSYRRHVYIDPPILGRVIMLGGHIQTLLNLREVGIATYRMTKNPTLPYEVAGKAPAYPFRLNCARLVLYYIGYVARCGATENMDFIMKSLSLVEPGGFWAGQDIVFNSAILLADRWEKLPIYFDGMAVWQKPFPGMFRQETSHSHEWEKRFRIIGSS